VIAPVRHDAATDEINVSSVTIYSLSIGAQAATVQSRLGGPLATVEVLESKPSP
jgi:hypothetical protein